MKRIIWRWRNPSAGYSLILIKGPAWGFDVGQCVVRWSMMSQNSFKHRCCIMSLTEMDKYRLQYSWFDLSSLLNIYSHFFPTHHCLLHVNVILCTLHKQWELLRTGSLITCSPFTISHFTRAEYNKPNTLALWGSKALVDGEILTLSP